MLSTLFEVGRAEVPCAQLGQGCFAGMCEFLEQSVERFSFTLVAVTEAFEGRKGLGLAELADDACTRHPVGTLGVEQMSHYIEGSPGVFAFIGNGPRVG